MRSGFLVPGFGGKGCSSENAEVVGSVGQQRERESCVVWGIPGFEEGFIALLKCAVPVPLSLVDTYFFFLSQYKTKPLSSFFTIHIHSPQHQPTKPSLFFPLLHPGVSPLNALHPSPSTTITSSQSHHHLLCNSYTCL